MESGQAQAIARPLIHNKLNTHSACLWLCACVVLTKCSHACLHDVQVTTASQPASLHPDSWHWCSQSHGLQGGGEGEHDICRLERRELVKGGCVGIGRRKKENEITQRQALCLLCTEPWLTGNDLRESVLGQVDRCPCRMILGLINILQIRKFLNNKKRRKVNHNHETQLYLYKRLKIKEKLIK